MRVPLLSLVAIMLLSFPVMGFATEQSFSQGGLKAVVKLSPDELRAGENVTVKLGMQREGTPVTDRTVTIEVYEKDSATPLLKREVERLDDEYLDTFKFEKPGDYRVVLNIADPQKSDQALHYEVMATVAESGDTGHDQHGFFSHHFGGGKWGWWGVGLMVLIMVPLMAVGL
ncbi:hAT transposon family protein [Geobacter sp.]|uniref:hAT transposon family protein n=1 Tax=Geobacter sp. TaxID=46610 RepID=UPI002622D7CA|nr:hAT transposon family protein [Geobacter sp.]